MGDGKKRERYKSKTRRGSRGKRSDTDGEARQLAATSPECHHCGCPEIDSEGHCDECGSSNSHKPKEN